MKQTNKGSMTKNKNNSIKIFKKAEFDFGHLDNAQRVAIALSMGGFYVKVTDNQPSYTVMPVLP